MLFRSRPVTLFFELPDTERVLDECAFWDIYYEHCSYFTPGSLERLFRRSGFEVTRQWKAFDDQYLMLEARPGAGVPAPDEAVAIDDRHVLLDAVVLARVDRRDRLHRRLRPSRPAPARHLSTRRRAVRAGSSNSAFR